MQSDEHACMCLVHACRATSMRACVLCTRAERRACMHVSCARVQSDEHACMSLVHACRATSMRACVLCTRAERRARVHEPCTRMHIRRACMCFELELQQRGLQCREGFCCLGKGHR